MKHRLLALIATLALLLTGCTTTAAEPVVDTASSQSGPDLSVPSWKTGTGWLSRYIISLQNGTPLECVIYTGGGLDCNWGGGGQ